MIVVKNLKKEYNKVTVLDIEKLDISEGQCFGLIGNNGAGKTTFFSLLLDLIIANKGNISNNNIPVNESEEWKKFTSAFIDETFLIGYLTPEEYFYFIGDLKGLKREEVDIFLEKFKLFFNNEILGKKKYLRDLSKGNQKKVGIVSTFIGNPKVIILDEPFANLDPSSQMKLENLIEKKSNEKNITILVSSHNLDQVTKVCKRIVVLDKGKIVKDINTCKETLEDLKIFFSDSDSTTTA